MGFETLVLIVSCKAPTRYSRQYYAAFEVISVEKVTSIRYVPHIVTTEYHGKWPKCGSDFQGGAMAKETVSANARHQFVVRSTEASARLEQRVVPPDHVRSTKVDKFVELYASRPDGART